MTAPVPETPPALAAARAFTARGWRPFPVEYAGKRPAVGIKWGTATASEPADATLTMWFAGPQPVNVGIAAKGSGLVILDDDTGDGMQRLCDAYGRPVPVTYRVRTRKGWHYYFDTPPDAPISNRPGFLADFGFDVRGGAGADGRGDGGYVVAAGSLHESGHVYEAEDPDADTVELPDWLRQLLHAEPEPEPEPPHEPRTDRRYTMDQAIAWVRKYAVDPLTAAPVGGRNNALNQAAIVVGHFVPAFFDEQYAVGRLEELADEVELDPAEVGPTIRSGLRAGMAAPYTLVERDPFASASGGSATESDAYEIDVDRKLRELRVIEEARRRLAHERRAQRPRIGDGVIDDLDAIPEPAMLLGSLIPDKAVGFLAGRSGAYKSFLATSWACCIATGRPWLGRSEFAVTRALRTLYVAAEGAGGAAGRIRAWEASGGASRRGRLLLYPRPIHLNDPAQVEELTAYIVEHGIEFLVVDTYHRSAPGTEENSATDFGIVFEAVAALRDEHDCSALFVDHTGAVKAGNPRGTSAKRDDADYVLSCTYQGEEATAATQRELFVTKLKDEDASGRWPIRLAEVEGQRFPVVEIGMVEVVSPFGGDDFGEWWRGDQAPEIPPDVAAAIQSAAAKDRNRGADAARWVWRYLAVVDDEQGVTRSQVERALGAIPRERPFTPAAIEKAIPLLDRAGIVGRDRTRVWLQGAVS